MQRRLLPLVLTLALAVTGCGDDGDEAPEDLSGICPPAGAADLNPFDVLATGSSAEVEESLASLTELYETVLDQVPDDAGYPEAVLSATTTVPATSVPEGGDDEPDEPDPPTPHGDLQLVVDVLEDVREVLARHGFDVAAAEEDLRAVPAFEDPDQLTEVVLASGRLRQLIQQECRPTPTTTPPPGAG